MTTEIEWWDYDDADEMAEAVAAISLHHRESAIDARGAAGDRAGRRQDPAVRSTRSWPRPDRSEARDGRAGDDRIVPLGDPLSNVTAIGKIFIPKGMVIPLTPDKAPDYSRGPLGRRAAPGRTGCSISACSAWAATGTALSSWPRFRRGAERAEGAPRAGRDARSPSPEAPCRPRQLSRAAIVSARAIDDRRTGEAKKEVLEAAIDQGASSSYPVGRLLMSSRRGYSLGGMSFSYPGNGRGSVAPFKRFADQVPAWIGPRLPGNS